MLHQLGNILVHEGRYKDALDTYERSLAIKRDIGDQRGIGLTLACMGEVARRQDRAADAARLWSESLPILQALGAPESKAVAAWLDATKP